jgi:hypothetical protein
MDTLAKVHQALEAAVTNVLLALFRVLFRHSMSYTAFDELARRAYVEVAMKDFAIDGKKSTISRASILSGLTRKEVRRLLSLPAAHPASWTIDTNAPVPSLSFNLP